MPGDIWGAAVDFYEGAKAGLAEYERAAVNLGMNASPEAIEHRLEFGEDGDHSQYDELTAQSLDWYNKAAKNLSEETVAPVLLTTLGLASGIGLAAGGGAAAWAATTGVTNLANIVSLSYYLSGMTAGGLLVYNGINGAMKHYDSQVAQKGEQDASVGDAVWSTTKETAVSGVPIAGSYYSNVLDDNWQRWADEHPGRAIFSLAFNEAANLGTMVGYKHTATVATNSLVVNMMKTQERAATIGSLIEADTKPSGRSSLKATNFTNKKAAELAEAMADDFYELQEVAIVNTENRINMRADANKAKRNVQKERAEKLKKKNDTVKEQVEAAEQVAKEVAAKAKWDEELLEKMKQDKEDAKAVGETLKNEGTTEETGSSIFPLITRDAKNLKKIKETNQETNFNMLDKQVSAIADTPGEFVSPQDRYFAMAESSFNKTLQKTFRALNGNKIIKNGAGKELVPAKPTMPLSNVTLTDIYTSLGNFKVAIRQGKRHMGGAEGSYNWDLNEIKHMGHQDLPVVMHELAHYLDVSYIKLIDKTPEGLRAELRKGLKKSQGKEIFEEYENHYKADPAKGLAHEGFANFFSEYMLNPESAKESFPKFYEYFTKVIDGDDFLTTNINKTSNLLRSWYDMDSGSRALSVITDARGSTSSFKQALREKAKAYVEDFISSYIDKTYFFSNTINKIAVAYDLDPEEIKGLKVHLAQMDAALNKGSTLEETFLGNDKELRPIDFNIRFAEELFATKDTFVDTTFKDVLCGLDAENIFPEVAKALDAYRAEYMPNVKEGSYMELFKAYAVARHSIEVYGHLSEKRLNNLSKDLTKIGDKLEKSGSDVTYLTAKLEEANKALSEVKGVTTPVARLNQLAKREGGIQKQISFNKKKLDKVTKNLYKGVKKGEDPATLPGKKRLATTKESLENKIIDDMVLLEELQADIAEIRNTKTPTPTQIARASSKVTELRAQRKKAVDEYNKIKKQYDDITENYKRLADHEDPVKTPIPMSDAFRLVKGAPEVLKETSERLAAFNHNILLLKQVYGFISRERRLELEETYPCYIPFARSLESETPMAFLGDKNVVENRAMNAMGSDRTVIDPVAVYLEEVKNTIKKGEQNKVMADLTRDLIAKTRNGEGFVDKLEGASIGDKLDRRNVYSVFENGERVFYVAQDLDLLKGLTSLDNASRKLSSSLILKGMQYAAQILRIGATSTPMFILWNAARDSVTAAVKSETVTTIPFWNLMKGIWYIKNEKELYKQFRMEGVSFSTRHGGTASLLNEVWDTTTFKPSGTSYSKKAGRGIVKAYQKLADLNNLVEEGPRMYEFVKALEKGESVGEAARRASDITTNFSKHGASPMFAMFTSCIPFFNTVVQGNVSLMKAFKKNPKAMMAKTMAFVTLPTISLWLMNKDKDWYRDLPSYEKFGHWFIEVGDTIYRIPKPELLGAIFGGAVEASLNYTVENDEHALDDLMHNIGAQAIPPLSSPIITTAFAQVTNYDFFRGRPIVSYYEQDKAPRDQYDAKTSYLARKMGDALNISPYRIDYTVNNLTGSAGAFALGLTNVAFDDNERPAQQLDEMFRFTRGRSGMEYSRTEEEFFKYVQQAREDSKGRDKKKAKQAKATLRIASTGSASIAKDNKRIKDILSNPKYSSEEKRAKIIPIKERMRKKMRAHMSKRFNYNYIMPTRK